jgi:hypothetical protein
MAIVWDADDMGISLMSRRDRSGGQPKAIFTDCATLRTKSCAWWRKLATNEKRVAD